MPHIEDHAPLEVSPQLVIRFPQLENDHDSIEQDQEICEVDDGKSIHTIRFHDYNQVYRIPGLYDRLFGGPASLTKCISPLVMASLVLDDFCVVDEIQPVRHSEQLQAEADAYSDISQEPIRILDFGAGNGMIAQEIRHLAARKPGWQRVHIVGFDILLEAKMAAERDRPGVYNDYIVADITKYVESQNQVSLCPKDSYNIVVSGSALAFGDAPADALAAAISLVCSGGRLVFNLNEQFLDIDKLLEVNRAVCDDGDFLSSTKDSLTSNPVREGGHDEASQETGFFGLLCGTIRRREISILTAQRYCHRLSTTGKELYYVAIIAKKLQ